MITSPPRREVDERHQKRSLEKAEKLLPPMREKARELGYALAVHGSLSCDIDLIAAPWTHEAVPASQLAQALMEVIADVNGIAFNSDVEWAANPSYFLSGCPGSKPFGRLSWAFHLGGGPYIDLSVMSCTHEPFPTAAESCAYASDPANAIKSSCILRVEPEGQ